MTRCTHRTQHRRQQRRIHPRRDPYHRTSQRHLEPGPSRGYLSRWRVTYDRHERQPRYRAGLARLAPLGEQLLRCHLPAPRHRRDHRPRRVALRHHPRLGRLVRNSPTAWTRQHLDSLITAPHVTHHVGPNVSPKLLEHRASHQVTNIQERRASLRRLRLIGVPERMCCRSAVPRPPPPQPKLFVSRHRFGHQLSHGSGCRSPAVSRNGPVCSAHP